MDQLNIFELTKDYFKFDKGHKIRMFEAFSGVGFQNMALQKVTDNYEIVGISEIDKYALESYKAIHGTCPNFGSITDIKGTDIPKDIDIFTYSFPCQDLSIAGKQKGLDNTRSGLVYEVLRILEEMKDKGNLPKVLIMENVVDLIRIKFIKQFNSIQQELENLGYSNYTATLNAKDYGVAQNRNRVFMVSILGDYYYEFPKPIPLEKRLRDYLLPINEVEQKYFLTNEQKLKLDNSRFESNKLNRVKNVNYVRSCLITSQCINSEPKISYPLASREHKATGWQNICPSLCARDYKDPKVLIQQLTRDTNHHKNTHVVNKVGGA